MIPLLLPSVQTALLTVAAFVGPGLVGAAFFALVTRSDRRLP
jgi:hypothetical protein